MDGTIGKRYGSRIFPLLFFLLLSLLTYAQREDPFSRRIPLPGGEVRLDTLLGRLASLSGTPFVYSPDRIAAGCRVSLPAGTRTLGEILDLISQHCGITYHLRGRKVVILPQGPGASGTSSLTLSGFVVDSHTGERLPYATIRAGNEEGGTAANSYGYFSLTLSPGTHHLQVSYVGYLPFSLTLQVSGDTSLQIPLTAAEASLRAVEVYRDHQESAGPAGNGMLRISPATVSAMPAFLGESDVVKSLEMMPGITFFGDGSTFFFVRGGNRDQNLVLVDDAPVYNPSHMFGIFSSVTPEAVKSVRVYKSYFPADVGGRLSSVVDIRTRDGDLRHAGVEGSLSPATLRLAVEGPLVREKSSFFLAARRSWFGWLPRLNDPSLEGLRFYDLNGRFNLFLNRRNRLYLSLYRGDDLYRQRSAATTTHSGITWGNLAGSLRWNHLIGKRMFLNTTLYGGSYDYDLVSSFEERFSWHSHVADFGVRSDLWWYRRLGDKVRAGAVVSGHNFNPGNIYYRGRIAGGTFPIVPVRNALGTALYVMREQQITPHLTLQYGLRFSSWSNAGSTWEYRYDESHRPLDSVWYGSGRLYHTYAGLDPRVSATLTVGSNTFTLAYSHTHQYMHLLTNQVTPFSSFEIWLPAGPSLRPQRAHQVQVGWSRPLGGGLFRLDAELYVRRLRGQVDYRDHAVLLLNPPLERDLRQGTAHVWGLETTLTKPKGRLTGWITYAYGRTFIHTPGINGDRRYPALWDRPHRLTAALHYRLASHWAAAANMIASSGTPFSSPTAFFQYQGQTVPWYGSRNNSRMPPYFRLDFSLTWKIATNPGKYRHDLVFTLFNATHRKNPFEINFNKIILPDNKLAVPVNLYSPPDLITTRMYLFTMIPSISYHFKF